jgi:hypothetical protein
MAGANLTFKVCVSLAILVSPVFGFCVPARSSAADDGDGTSTTPKTPPKLTAVGCITWWSHDAVGYHPAMIVRVENSSGQNLVGERLRLQGRFTDLRNGYVTVARKEERLTLLKNEQQYIMLRGPSSFELPIDEFAWPSIECKAMARVGEVGDEGTQDLLITHLEAVTMTDDEARAQLARQTDFRKVVKVSSNSPSYQPNTKSASVPDDPPKPMIATAGGLVDKRQTNDSFKHLNLPAALPSLGEDFYLFEKCFGIPLQIEAAKPATTRADLAKSLTWASYKSAPPFTLTFVGTKSGSAADVIVVAVPVSLGLPESQYLAVARALIGKGMGGQLSNFTHSVRYLTSGRSEVSLASAPGCHVLSYKITGDDGSPQQVIAVSRLGGDLESALIGYASQARMLHSLLNR